MHTIEIIDNAGMMINEGTGDEIYLVVGTTVLHLRMTSEETIGSGQGTTGATITVGPILLTGHPLVVHLQELALALSRSVLVSQRYPQDHVPHLHPFLPILYQLLVLGPPQLLPLLHPLLIPVSRTHLSRLPLP